MLTRLAEPDSIYNVSTTSIEVIVMRTAVQKWGNSLSVRLPKAVTEQVGLKESDALDIEIEDNRVVLVPRKAAEYTLKGLLKGVTKKNLHGAEDFGVPVGREML